MTHGAIIPATQATDARRVGGKAASLARLLRAGFDVPAFFVIVPEAFEDSQLNGCVTEIEAAAAGLCSGRFAVRSSGRDEDGAAHSHAGQFLSVLGVSAADIAQAARQVWESAAASSVKAYRNERGLAPKAAPQP